MPPPATLIGIAAAALGLSNRQSWASERYSRHLKVSVLTDSEPGSARQMWTVLKIKGNNIAEVFLTFGHYFPSPLHPGLRRP
jgi:CRISPR-associated protein Cas5t